MNNNLLYAEIYAKLGWHIFPLQPETKVPLEGLVGGFKAATNDIKQITKWWTVNPKAGIGLYPQPSGLSVLDIDTKDGHQGVEELEALQYRFGALPPTLTQITPSGSGAAHLIFKCDKPLGNNKLSLGIDIRCANGYICIEPTKLSDGSTYGWLDWEVLLDDLPPIATLPEWVIKEQAQRASKTSAKRDLTLPRLDFKAQLNESLKSRLSAFLEQSPKAMHRWLGGTDGLTDITGSAKDFSMVALLKIAGFDYQETVSLILPWTHGSTSKDRLGDRYWQRAWTRTSDPEPIEADSIQWREAADPFIKQPTPLFPLDCLPECFANAAIALSAGSGFDAGAYGFAMLVAASGLIDHRKRLSVGPMRVPPNLWGGLVAQSGGGKSPVLSAATANIESANSHMLRRSTEEIQEWQSTVALLRKAGELGTPPRPPLRQLVIDDSTTEALRKIMPDNPEGLLMIAPEISEWIGRMDAYSAGSKDRGVWIRAFDTGAVTINRAGQDLPTHIENCSVALLAGIQPEILGMKFSKSDGAGADGLYQRLLCYQMQEQREVDYFAPSPIFEVAEAHKLLDRLLYWRENNFYEDMTLSKDAITLAEDYHRAIVVIARRTPAKRLAEHLGKYPGLLGRVAFVLQILFDAEDGLSNPSEVVTKSTFEKALEIMRVLLRHAEAVYTTIDAHSMGETSALVKSAAEAILSKGWVNFKSGDLTRYATGWRNVGNANFGNAYKTAAIDLLIDLGWIVDITTSDFGRRGRPAQGSYLVNESVHKKFALHAERITNERQERYAAIQRAAHSRERELVESQRE